MVAPLFISNWVQGYGASGICSHIIDWVGFVMDLYIFFEGNVRHCTIIRAGALRIYRRRTACLGYTTEHQLIIRSTKRGSYHTSNHYYGNNIWRGVCVCDAPRYLSSYIYYTFYFSDVFCVAVMFTFVGNILLRTHLNTGSAMILGIVKLYVVYILCVQLMPSSIIRLDLDFFMTHCVKV